MPRLEAPGFLVFLFLGLLPASLAAAPHPRVAAIVRQVQATGGTAEGGSFDAFMRALPVDETAERGYHDNGLPQDDLVEARTVILESLVGALGRSQVSVQEFEAHGCKGANIVGILPGRGPRQGERYVITAHYDSDQNPGADDNGSGVAGLLEAARVLGAHRFDATLVFVATDQEEERDRNGWGRGSQYYARKAAAARADIRAVVAMDMIAYNHQGSDMATISRVDHAAGSRSHRLSSEVARAFRDYSGLRVTTRTGEDESDPYRFFKAGYPVVLVSELFDAEGMPLNPYYHSAMDYDRRTSGRPQKHNGKDYIDPAYAARLIRGVVGWAATAAGVLDGE